MRTQRPAPIAHSRDRRWITAAIVAAMIAAAGCQDQATTPLAPVSESEASTKGLTHSNAPFPNWHQGFNHGTGGWYGGETLGELGWCGALEHVTRQDGSVDPSAGHGYATVAQGSCNAHWAEVYGTNLVGAPWAPGPDFAGLFGPWPESGYVMELDIYLDPSYEAVGPEEGTYVVEVPAWKGAVFGYSASFATLHDMAFHYVWIPAMSGDGELLIGEGAYPVTEAGWYTFRYVFRADQEGQLAVEFELEERRGRTLYTESMDQLFFAPSQSPSDYSVENVGTGYVWFSSISRGLDLPIDEYRVRRGG